MFNHNLGVVLKAFDKRNAISGVIAPFSFMILDRVFLETLKSSATSEIVKERKNLLLIQS